MTISLEDVTLLFGLPCAGEAMEVVDLPSHGVKDILARFAPVVCNAHVPRPANDFTNIHGSSWLWQHIVHTTIYLFIVFSYNKSKQFNKFRLLAG
jgi:hypothetical protein